MPTGKPRPKLLFLSQTLPFPPDGGVKIRTYHILKILAEAFETTALCFYRWKRGLLSQDTKQSVEALSRIAEVEAFPIPQEHHRGRLIWDHFRSLATGRPYTVFSYESRDFRNRLHELLDQRTFDVVHADSLDLSTYFPVVQDLPLACVHHDAQSQLLQRRSRYEKTWWRRVYLRHQSGLMQREEQVWCSKVDLNVTVSENDRMTLQGKAPDGAFEVVPNGVDVDFFQPRGRVEDQGGLVFVGGTTWFPNRDALKYFGDVIGPLLRLKGVSAPVTWVGRASEQEIAAFGDLGLNLTGYVPDIRPYVNPAACYIVPLRVGGGTRIKILDAWAMGKAVVSTSIGCEGLSVEDGRNILIRDRPEDFVDAIREILDKAELRARLGKEGRRTVVDEYSWKAIGLRMVKKYHQLLR